MYEDIKTACLYVRFSSHNQTEQSIEGQTRVCRDFCKRHNIRIVEIYADRATSASKDIEKRVQFLKMIKDSEKGLFDAVIVYKLDRFARSRYDSATYKYRLKRNGVQLISATENISNDPEGIILESVLEGMAEFYSAELSQKINRGMRESAYKHNSIGGAVPLGYKIEDKKLVIDPKTAPIVKEAFEKYADGETVAEICRQFNARGYKTSKGTAFGKSSFTKIFRNERYIGVYTFHDYRAEDAIPAIIDKDLWDRVQVRVGKIKNAPARNKAKVVYLLSGKIFCGHCGSKMNGNCNAGNYYYYQCYGKKNGNVDCKKKNIRKEFIERLVAQDALSLLTDEYIEQIATIACKKNQHEIELDSALPTIRDRIHQVDLSLNNLLKAIESGSAPDMLVKRMGELEKEKKDLQAQAKKESEDIVELDKAQVIYWLEQFRGGSIEDEEFCRMLIDLFVNSVTVWDKDDNTYKVTVAYNLTSLPTKTYRLNKGGTLSDFTSNAPGQHARGERPTPAGQIHKGAARADYADQSFQVGVAAGSGCPLYITQVGPAHHTDASAAPWLGGDPVQSIVAVLHLVVVGQPFAFTGVSAAHILYYHRVAALDVTVVYLTAVLFAVGGAYQHCGHRGTAVFRQVYVGGKMYPVPHGHREGLRMFYREQLFLRPGRAPQAQDGLILGTGFHQHRDHLPGRAGDGNQPPFLHLFVVGEFYIPLQVAAAVFAGVALAAQGNFPGAMQPRLVLGQVLPQGGKVHLHKETVKIPVLFSQVLPVQQRAGMHIQFPDLGCAVAQPQSAVQDA